MLDEKEAEALHVIFKQWYKSCKSTGVYPTLLIGFPKEGEGAEMIIYKAIDYPNDEVVHMLEFCLQSMQLNG